MQPTDPLYAQQWHFTKLGNIEKIWDEFSGAGIHVGVYDSGIDLTHVDLAANYDPTRRVIINGTPLDGEPNATTPDPHGTRVVGLINEVANNGEGGVGVAWGSTFTSVGRLFDASSPLSANFPNFYSGFHQLVNFEVTNHSWNGTASFAYTTTLNLYGGDEYENINNEYDYASSNGRGGLGTIIVQGVANNNFDAQYSGINASRFTISVGGTQEDGFASDFSNYGACLLVTAPSRNIVTTDITGSAGIAGNYVDAALNAAFPPNGLSGTSLSGPIVSGAVALMLDANPNLGWRDVQNIIAASATHTGSAIGAVSPGTNENSNWFINDAFDWNGGGRHFSNDYGYGAVNAYNAVRMAEVWSLFAQAQTSANEAFWHTEDDTDRVIPDNGVLQFSVPILPSFVLNVEHVELRVDLTHTDYRQLRIFLVSPSGTEMQLFDGSGGSDTTADGSFNWTYAGEALRGEDASGNWTVRFVDTAAGETGTLLWYNLVVYGAAASTDSVYHYTDEFLAMAALAGESGRATLTDTNGGTDWIDAAAVTGNVALNLNAGATTTVNGANWFTIAGGSVIENAVTGDGNDSLTGNDDANKLYGMRGNDSISGQGGDDTLNGGVGDDTLDGGAGADTLAGGPGNDTYIVDSASDSVIENANEGTDTIRTALASFSLEHLANVENLIGTSTGGQSLTGNGGANFITGGADNDTIDGRAGDDTMDGGLGDDTAMFSGSLAGYTIQDFGAKILVSGLDGNDTLSGFEHFQFDNASLTVINDGNPLFDALYYLSRYADVYAAGVDPLSHFNTFGWLEGRAPNAFFDTTLYRSTNPGAANANPLDQYDQSGWHQGADPGPNFDTRLYLLHNPDVAAAGVEPLAHYLLFGFTEGRQAYQAIGATLNGFDAEYYLLHNPDVAASGVDPLAHFNTFGWHEGRNPNAWFDTAGYLSHYADVAALGINPLDHYEQFGWKEGRDPSAAFDTLGYLAAYADVAAAGVNPLDHYINFGIYEGRQIVNDGLWH